MNQTKNHENRREFLKRASLAAVAFPFLINCRRAARAQKAAVTDDELSLIKKNAITDPSVNWCGAKDAPADVSWRMSLPKKAERDEPMIISGTVFQADGKTAAPNVLIYFYHTDSDGFYGCRGGALNANEHLHGHFRGWLLTDSRGRYEFNSIRPAAYPNRTFAAHVHMTITGKDFREDSIDSILFEGDKFITGQERGEAGRKGGFNPIIKLERDANGAWRGRRDIQLWQI